MAESINRVIEAFVPVDACSLRCPYCYVTLRQLFNNKNFHLPYSPEQIGYALRKERLGGPCFVNLCGNGETLIPPVVVGYVRELLSRGHYVGLVMNGTLSARFQELSRLPGELLGRLFLKFSYHYLELKRLNLLNRFFDNIRLMRDAGASFVLELTPSDETIPYIEELKQVSLDNLGALCHITIARDESVDGKLPILTSLSDEEFYKTWGVFDCAMFDFKKTIFGQKRKEFCYAGDWSFSLDLGSGRMRQCYKSLFSANILDNPDVPIPFKAIGHFCQECHCYNGHSFLSWGVIPSKVAPTYAEERNRVCPDGSEWLRPQMKQFMSSRLFDANREYPLWKKAATDVEMAFRILKQRLFK